MAFEQLITKPSQTGAFFRLHKIPGEFYEIFRSISFSLTTSAALGTRRVVFEVRTPDNQVVLQVPAADTQAPGAVGSYEFGSSITSPWGMATSVIVTPFPGILFPPSYELWFDTVSGDTGGDIYSGIALYNYRLPTGPRRNDSTGEDSRFLRDILSVARLGNA